MPADRHPHICALIDTSLAGAASAQDEQSVREHLLTCDACRQYADDSRRAIAALEGFRFDLDPRLDGRVMAALAARAQQLEEKRIETRQLWRACGMALLLTLLGSLAASQLGGLAAGLLHVEPAQIQFGVAALWIVPSLCICLLLLLLPVSPAGWTNRKGWSL